VARLSKLEKEDLGFWINAKGEVEYHKKCARCAVMNVNSPSDA